MFSNNRLKLIASGFSIMIAISACEMPARIRNFATPNASGLLTTTTSATTTTNVYQGGQISDLNALEFPDALKEPHFEVQEMFKVTLEKTSLFSEEKSVSYQVPDRNYEYLLIQLAKNDGKSKIKAINVVYADGVTQRYIEPSLLNEPTSKKILHSSDIFCSEYMAWVCSQNISVITLRSAAVIARLDVEYNLLGGSPLGIAYYGLIGESMQTIDVGSAELTNEAQAMTWDLTAVQGKMLLKLVFNSDLGNSVVQSITPDMIYPTSGPQEIFINRVAQQGAPLIVNLNLEHPGHPVLIQGLDTTANSLGSTSTLHLKAFVANGCIYPTCVGNSDEFIFPDVPSAAN